MFRRALAFATCFAATTTSRAAAQGKDSGSRATDHVLGRGHYLAVAADQTAWLLYLDPIAGTGALYDPVRSVVLCDLRTDSVGRLSFQTADYHGAQLRFTGKISSAGFAGTLTRVAGNRGTILRSVPLDFAPIHVTSQGLSGVYGNLRAARSGDIYGVELVFLDAVSALWVQYEGSPDMPKLLKTDVVRDTLHITWPLPKGPQSDTAIVRSDTLRFRHGLRLVKTSSLSTVLSSSGPSRCP